MAKTRLPESTLIVIWVVIFVVLTGAFGALSYIKWRRINELRAETALLEIIIADLQKKIDQLDEKERERDELAAQIHEYEKMLPDSREVENLMTTISEQAAKSDCSVANFSLSGGRRALTVGAAGAPYEEVKFDVQISSTKARKGYYCACKFLNLLERYKRFIAADTFRIGGGSGKDASMSMSLSAHTYVFTGKKTPEAQGGRGGKKR